MVGGSAPPLGAGRYRRFGPSCARAQAAARINDLTSWRYFVSRVWCDGGIFASEGEAAFAAAQETGESKIIELLTGEDPRVEIARLKRSLVIARLQGPDRRMLLIGFSFRAPNPRPRFDPTTDAGKVVKFQTERLDGRQASPRPHQDTPIYVKMRNSLTQELNGVAAVLGGLQ